MADEYTTLNAGSGGSVMDETGITYPSSPTTRKRPRVVIAGENIDDIAPVSNTAPSSTDRGLVVRPVPDTTGPGEANVVNQQSVTLVPSNVETTVSQYIVPAGKSFYVTSWYFSGDVNAKYFLYINDELQVVMRTTVAQISGDSHFHVIRPSASESQTVKVTVQHAASGIQANFDATIMGYLTSL